MSTDIDDDQDCEQPITLAEWFARAKAELADQRAKAHAYIDEVFDRHAGRLECDRARIARDLGLMKFN